MGIDWTFDGCDEMDEMDIERYWEQVQAELEGKVAELSDPVSYLGIAVEKNDAEPFWMVHAALHLPGATLVAEAAANAHEQAIDRMLAQLAQHIDQWEDLPATVTRRRDGLEGVAVLLDAWHSGGRSEAFLSFLLPVAISLGPYIERELQLRESEGALSAAAVTSYDVIDEVLVLAWERFAARSRALAVDLWLMQLADEAMNRLSRDIADNSIDDEQPAPLGEEPRAFEHDAWDEWVEHVAYRETVAMAELLPGERRIDSWDELAWEARHAHLAELLAGLKHEQRQALVLNTVYGYSPAQIADFQQRPARQIEADIAAGITDIRRRFEKQEESDWEEAFARQQMRRSRQRFSHHK